MIVSWRLPGATPRSRGHVELRVDVLVAHERHELAARAQVQRLQHVVAELDVAAEELMRDRAVERRHRRRRLRGERAVQSMNAADPDARDLGAQLEAARAQAQITVDHGDRYVVAV